jgi:hypothetical protein
MRIRHDLIIAAVIASGLLACQSRDTSSPSEKSAGVAAAPAPAPAAAPAPVVAATATTNAFVASCVIKMSGITICTDYYDCVGADAAKIKSECATRGGGVGADTKCAAASSGGLCTLAPSGGTPCSQVQVMPAGEASANKQICETNLKGTYKAP